MRKNLPQFQICGRSSRSMTHYKKFTVEQFLTDQAFRQWVHAPNPGLTAQWQDWLEQHPEKAPDIEKARLLLTVIDEKYKHTLSEHTIEQDINEIVQRAKSGRSRRALKWWNKTVLWRLAAVVVISCGIAWLYYTNHRVGSGADAILAASTLDGEMMVKTNNANEEMTVLLSDNSVATLMKGSSITYPARFSGGERKVFLSGEAFFDITKNPAKPFLVFANETVTKVLGTSFRVKAFEQDPEVLVLVKTGRVSVYAQKEYELLTSKTDREVAGVILNPNQQVVFRKKDSRLEKGIVSNPGMLAVSADQKELIFDDKPVTEVLQALENIYGIVIVYDAESLSACVISAQFNEENLKERMSAICQAIGATYEMLDGQIIVNSKGCNT
jgi:transmembrane sensor